MSTLTDLARVLRALWRECAGCGVLFPAAPDQTRCPSCGGWS
jgi:rRNA maturation endonuclease Nob1